MFRRLEHAFSPLFSKKAINPKGLVGPFKARDYLLEAEKIRSALIEREEKQSVSETVLLFFDAARQNLILDNPGNFIEITDAEKSFFIMSYPLSMLGVRASTQAAALLKKSNPEISRNNVSATKNSLEGLHAVLRCGRFMSLVRSESGLDILSGITKLRFEGFGDVYGLPLNTRSMLISMSKDALNYINGEISQMDRLIDLGYLSIPIFGFANGYGRDDMMIQMIESNKEFGPWLFDSVFVVPMLGKSIKYNENTLKIYNEDNLKAWHIALASTMPEDAMNLILLESKIQTIVAIAQAVAAREQNKEA